MNGSWVHPCTQAGNFFFFNPMLNSSLLLLPWGSLIHFPHHSDLVSKCAFILPLKTHRWLCMTHKIKSQSWGPPPPASPSPSLSGTPTSLSFSQQWALHCEILVRALNENTNHQLWNFFSIRPPSPNLGWKENVGNSSLLARRRSNDLACLDQSMKTPFQTLPQRLHKSEKPNKAFITLSLTTAMRVCNGLGPCWTICYDLHSITTVKHSIWILLILLHCSRPHLSIWSKEDWHHGSHAGTGP